MRYSFNIYLFSFLSILFCLPSASKFKIDKNNYINNDSTFYFNQHEIDSIGSIINILTQKENSFKLTQDIYEQDSLNRYLHFENIKKEIQNLQIGYLNLVQTTNLNKQTNEQQIDTAFQKAHVYLTKIESNNLEFTRSISEDKDKQNQVKLINQIRFKRKSIQDSIFEISNNLYSRVVKNNPTGYFSRIFFNKKYRFFICDSMYDISFLYNSKKEGVSIEKIISNQVKKPLMVTNGGMFHPSFNSVGLFIENGIEKNIIDTFSNRPDNFYLLPNGVFFIDNQNKFSILESNEFVKQQFPIDSKKKNYKTIKYATQSGPLLIKNGKFNSKLILNSKNENIRNGVGVMKDGRVVFLISDERVNFYEFTMVFRYFFNCLNALYLDGAISKMYIADKLLSSGEKNDFGGSFGPMISVTKK